MLLLPFIAHIYILHDMVTWLHSFYGCDSILFLRKMFICSVKRMFLLFLLIHIFNQIYTQYTEMYKLHTPCRAQPHNSSYYIRKKKYLANAPKKMSINCYYFALNHSANFCFIEPSEQNSNETPNQGFRISHQAVFAYRDERSNLFTKLLLIAQIKKTQIINLKNFPTDHHI